MKRTPRRILLIVLATALPLVTFFVLTWISWHSIIPLNVAACNATTSPTTRAVSKTSFDVQADLLNFVAQESVAHAALVFATLSAAFAFATVRSKREANGTKWTVKEMLVFCVVLFLLFFGGIYAMLRFTFYAAISDYALNHPSPVNETLSHYWANVTATVQDSHWWEVPFSGIYNAGAFGLIASGILAYLFAFLVTLLSTDHLSKVSVRRTLLLGVVSSIYSISVALLINFGPTRPYSVLAGFPLAGCVFFIGARDRPSSHAIWFGIKGWKAFSIVFYFVAFLPVILQHVSYCYWMTGSLLFGSFTTGWSPLPPLLALNIGYVLYELGREASIEHTEQRRLRLQSKIKNPSTP